MRTVIVAAMALVFCWPQQAQDITSENPKDRAKAARNLGDSGSEAIPKLAPLLSDPVLNVRQEAVESLVGIGTQHSLEPLALATRDNDPAIQILATDGIVNFYLPGYMQGGLQRLGIAIRSRFDRENTQVIEPYVTVRPEVIEALGRLARSGSSMESRANAARALGILRGKAAIPDLLEALKTKDDAVLFESLIALQKIGDRSVGPRVDFLLRDLNERVQVAAIETAGLLQNRDAIPQLRKVFDDARKDNVRRAALSALAMIPDSGNRAYYQRGFDHKDEKLRAAAAEGYARLKETTDLPAVQQAFNQENKMAPRLAQAFAVVSLGDVSTGEFAPLTYLVNTLNSRQYRNVAEAYLTELLRDGAARQGIYPMLRQGTKEEKSGLARALAASGDAGSVTHLEALSKDDDADVAQAALGALRMVKARLP